MADTFQKELNHMGKIDLSTIGGKQDAAVRCLKCGTIPNDLQGDERDCVLVCRCGWQIHVDISGRSVKPTIACRIQ